MHSRMFLKHGDLDAFCISKFMIMEFHIGPYDTWFLQVIDYCVKMVGLLLQVYLGKKFPIN